MVQIDHAVVDVLVVDNGRYLLVEESKPGRAGQFNLPGGHVDNHESLQQAAIRETREETGYEVQLTGFIGLYQSIYLDLNIAGPVFSAKLIGGAARTSTEHPSSRWVTGDELRQMAASGQLFTTYPPYAVDHYEQRGSWPLDTVLSFDRRA